MKIPQQMHVSILFDSFQEHRPSHGSSREPLLENITSDYDLELFRKAQARASDDLVREKTHHISAHLFSPFPFHFHESVKIAGGMSLRTTDFWDMQWAHAGFSSTVASTLLLFSHLLHGVSLKVLGHNTLSVLPRPPFLKGTKILSFPNHHDISNLYFIIF